MITCKKNTFMAKAMPNLPETFHRQQASGNGRNPVLDKPES
jgi:hypothetical protein